MATTRSQLAVDALAAFDEADVRYALLQHPSPDFPASVTSDLDLVVAEPARALLPRLLPGLRRRGLHPIISWVYDAGGATTIFLGTGDASDGAQIDLVHDTHGLGVDGLRAPPLLAQSIPDAHWWRVCDTHELLYSLRKRHRKHDWSALERLVAQARELPSGELRVEAFRIFAASIARQVCRLVESWPERHVPRRPARVRLHEASRLADRVVLPVGFWVELQGKNCSVHARSIASRFGRFVPHVASGCHPDTATEALPWLVQDVARVRWRAGVFVSWTDRALSRFPRPFGPDLTLYNTGAWETAAAEIVAAMEARVLARAQA